MCSDSSIDAANGSSSSSIAESYIALCKCGATDTADKV
jgi:hypothetical protein